MRCFIAAEIPNEAKEYLAEIQKALKEKLKAKWVKKENLHITLEFLGEIEPAAVESAKNALEGLQEKQFDFYIQGLNCFPQPKKARVLFAQGKDSLPLFGIYNYIRKKTRKITQNYKKHPFSPHITLARLKIPQDISTLLNKTPAPEALKYKINRITLFESKLEKAGPVYFKIFTKTLAE